MPDDLTGTLKTAVLTVLIAWAGLWILGAALRFGGPMVVWGEDAPFARNAWAPFPGVVVVDEHVRGWSACRRQALMVHEEVHWDQQLRYLILGMWGPFLAGEYLGIGDFHRRMEVEAEQAEQAFLEDCAG